MVAIIQMDRMSDCDSGDTGSIPVGRPITLRGKTRKGKNRIQQFGSEWTVLKFAETVAFEPDSSLGPWLLIRCLRSALLCSCQRWIRMINDPDFKITTDRNEK